MNIDTITPIIIKGFIIWSGRSGATCDPVSYTIYGGNVTSGWDQGNYNVISSGAIYPFINRQSSQTILFTSNTISYQRYLVRFNLSTDARCDYMEISEFQLLTSSDSYITYAIAYPRITSISHSGSCGVNGLSYYNCRK